MIEQLTTSTSDGTVWKEMCMEGCVFEVDRTVPARASTEDDRRLRFSAGVALE